MMHLYRTTKPHDEIMTAAILKFEQEGDKPTSEEGEGSTASHTMEQADGAAVTEAKQPEEQQGEEEEAEVNGSPTKKARIEQEGAVAAPEPEPFEMKVSV